MTPRGEQALSRFLSVDRVAEAEYFLGLLETADPASNAFRYLSAAAVSAIRSISFVLQKDLRHAQGFNAWFEERKAKTNRTRYSELNRLRTALQKEGSEFPILCYQVHIGDGPVSYVRLRHCPADIVNPVRSVELQLRAGHPGAAPLRGRPLTASDKLSPSELEAALELLSLTPFASRLAQLVGVVDDLDPTSPSLHPKVFVQRLQDILDEQRELVMDALTRFRNVTTTDPTSAPWISDVRVSVPVEG